MAQLIGRNKGVEYVKNMVHQRESTGMEYPSDTNNRGNSNRHHHAEGDMVMHDKDESQKHSLGDMVNTIENAFHAEGDMVDAGNKKARGGMMRQRHAMGDAVMGMQNPMPGQMQNPIRPTSTMMSSGPRQF